MTEAIEMPASAGTLEHVNPNDLAIEANVRTEASLTKQFVNSIRENGVLVPIVAIRNTAGTLEVRAGQRRTLAAREAGLQSVPVYVTNAERDVATRLVQQITENDQRQELGEVDRIKGIQQLLDTGLSATKVAKQLAVPAERVKQSKAVAGSATAMAALHHDEVSISLAEAAGIAEFEDDEDAVGRLMRAAGRNYFDQELERLRQARVEAKARAEAVASYQQLGYTVLDRYPEYGSGQVPLNQLLVAAADGGYNPADESVITDPRQWSVIIDEEELFLDKESGEPVDETTIDWATEGNPEAVPGEGMIHADTIIESIQWNPTGYFCHDPEAAGLAVTERYTKLAAAAASAPEGTKVESSADLAAKAAAKAERKKVIELNKAAEAAEVVRRKFVAAMLKRKTAPKGAMLFVAERLIGDGTLLGSHKGSEIASELLGAEVRSGELLDHASDARAEVVLLGMAAGAGESLTGKSAWRGPSDVTIAYLRFLAENGYGLSPVEQVMVGDMSAEHCLQEMADE